jgi:hypothetical protein
LPQRFFSLILSELGFVNPWTHFKLLTPRGAKL